MRKKNRIITFSLGLVLKDGTLIDEVKSSTLKNFEIVLQRASVNDKITLTLDDLAFDHAALQIPKLHERNLYTITGTADDLSVAVRDAIATYP